MWLWLTYVLAVVLAVGTFMAADYLFTPLDLYLADPSDKSLAPVLLVLRFLIAAVISAVVVYPVLRRLVFRAKGSFLRYALACGLLLLLFEAWVRLAVAGVLSRPMAAALLVFLVTGVGFYLMRDWVFRPQGGTKGRKR